MFRVVPPPFFTLINGYVCMCARTVGLPLRAEAGIRLSSPEVGLGALGSCELRIWVLGSKLRSSAEQ